jgi:hypothetical protein
MRVLAAILTYRPKATNRLGTLADTFDSLADEADAVWVVDNGSGAEEWAAIVDTLGVEPFTHDGPNTTCGHGTNLQARVLAGAAQPGDICVRSDDDMAWRPGWADKLAAWWESAPADVILTGCHLEPIYGWNGIEERVEHGGVRGFYRASTGAASWSYRALNHSLIFPIPERVQGTGDVPACAKVRGRGRVAQIDLADHVGQVSTWGNRTVDLYGWEVAPVRALLEGVGA